MDKDLSISFGQLLGLEIRVRASAAGTAFLIASTIFLFLWKVLKWRPWTALGGGILASVIHYLSEVWHQLGHARAAEQSGFPMQGVTFVGPIGISVYPEEEGLLPPETHIQRALGGPIFSVLLALTFGVLSLATRYVGGLPLFLTAFIFSPP